MPGEPGWAFPVVYYHVSADADGSKNFIRGGNLTAGLDAKADLAFFFPTYRSTSSRAQKPGSFTINDAMENLSETGCAGH